MVDSTRDVCVVCKGTGAMPKLSPEQSAARDAPIDEIGEATVQKIMRWLQKHPGRAMMAHPEHVKELHDFLLKALGDMLGEMTIVKLKAMGVDLTKPDEEKS